MEKAEGGGSRDVIKIKHLEGKILKCKTNKLKISTLRQ